eukprot:5595251-Prymnesium_polylepis.1
MTSLTHLQGGGTRAQAPWPRADPRTAEGEVQGEALGESSGDALRGAPVTRPRTRLAARREADPVRAAARPPAAVGQQFDVVSADEEGVIVALQMAREERHRRFGAHRLRLGLHQRHAAAHAPAVQGRELCAVSLAAGAHVDHKVEVDAATACLNRSRVAQVRRRRRRLEPHRARRATPPEGLATQHNR